MLNVVWNCGPKQRVCLVRFSEFEISSSSQLDESVSASVHRTGIRYDLMLTEPGDIYSCVGAQQNKQYDMCTQQIFRSAWKSTQFDLCCPHEECFGPYYP